MVINMVEKNKYFLALDIGAEYIRAILSEVDFINKETRIVSNVCEQIIDSDTSNIYNDNYTSVTLKNVLKKIKQKVNIEDVYVNISDEHVISETINSTIVFERTSKITPQILEQLNEISTNSINKKEEIIYLRTNKYIIDKKMNITDPLNMEASSIEAENFIVRIESRYLDQIDSLLASVNLKATSIIPNSIAAGEALITAQERNLGSVVIDVGYKTTDIATFSNGNITLAFTLSIGISDFIDMLSKVLKITYKDAYYIYKNHTNLLKTTSDAPIVYKDLNGNTCKVPIGVVNKIVEDLIKQLFDTIKTILEKNIDNKKIHSIVISGGISKISGIKNILIPILDISRIKTGRVIETFDKSPELFDNTWAICLGMVNISQIEIDENNKEIFNIIYKIKTFFENIFNKI